MNKKLKNSFKNIVKKSGFEIHKNRGEFPDDFSNRDIEIIQKVKPYTMTSNERIFVFI